MSFTRGTMHYSKVSQAELAHKSGEGMIRTVAAAMFALSQVMKGRRAREWAQKMADLVKRGPLWASTR